MKGFTLKELQNVTSGRLVNAESVKSVEIKRVVSDSRKVAYGTLFLCIKGEKVDGHNFAKQAIDNGALAVVAEKEIPGFFGPVLLVNSVAQATLLMAEYRRTLLDIPFIGITGSVGKTSTKEFIASVLATTYKVHKTEGNLNNEWGVPFTIFEIEDDAEIAVIEMGISNFGEMSILSRIVKPDIVVITNIGEAHLEYLGNRDGVLKAKTEIFKYMNKHGLVVLNGDDDKLRTIEQVYEIKPLFYGLNRNNNSYPSHIHKTDANGSEFNLSFTDTEANLSLHVNLPLPGKHMIANAAAAYLIGVKLGVSILDIKAALEKISTLVGRNNIIKTDDYTIIDDCYNASPTSMKSSIDLLKLYKSRQVAILGDMLELGEDSSLLHAKVGEYAAKAGIDVIVCIGLNSKQIYLSAKMSTDKEVYHFPNVEECIETLPKILIKGDTVLVKASNAMHLGDIVSFINK